MNDKELADKVVALGVLTKSSYEHNLNNTPVYQHNYIDVGAADTAVRDWRVAGALMEQLSALKISNVFDDLNFYACWDTTSNNKPRAIIEACVEALASEADND